LGQKSVPGACPVTKPGIRPAQSNRGGANFAACPGGKTASDKRTLNAWLTMNGAGQNDPEKNHRILGLQQEQPQTFVVGFSSFCT